jgi:glutamyl-Q tRNA(Asp) synthetase
MNKPGQTPTYRGRFAPSPTGPLHFGSLIAAVASYCQARSSSGEWLVRIEDIDPPREVPGSSDSILQTLERFGFQWDGEVVYQSHRSRLYTDALDDLIGKKRLYPCACSRKEIAKTSKMGVYPGTCRQGLPGGRHARSWRLLTGEDEIYFSDAIQGPQSYSMERDIGDFVLKRADGLFAYQLAVAIDDSDQGITQVVRGSDLLDSAPRQIYLQQQLGINSAEYAHHPIVVDDQGEKLSKQKLAPALDQNQNQLQAELYRALRFLGQPVPAELLDSDLDSLWKWAIENWSMEYIPRKIASSIEQGSSEDRDRNLDDK